MMELLTTRVAAEPGGFPFVAPFVAVVRHRRPGSGSTSPRDDGWTWSHGRGAVPLAPAFLGRPAARGDTRMRPRRFSRHSLVIKVPDTRSPCRDAPAADDNETGQSRYLRSSLISVANSKQDADKISKIVLLTAPPAGFEPAHPPPEGGALSPELWGLAHIMAMAEFAKGPSKSIRSTDRRTRRRSARMSWPKPITSRRDSGTWPRAGCRR